MSPIREFFCSDCEELKEIISQVEPPDQACLKCGGLMERIMISKTNFKLRGFGWSEDGYSNNVEDAEEFWARDGQPTMPHVKGSEHYIQGKKEELKKAISKNLRKT